MCLVPCAIMFAATQGVFSPWVTGLLSALAAVGFYTITDGARKHILCEHIVGDIRNALNSIGHGEVVFELKSLKIGIVVRVYLISAKQKTTKCTRAVVDSISNAWYRRYVCATQIVDLENEGEVKNAQLALDEELLADLRSRTEKEKNKKDK